MSNKYMVRLLSILGLAFLIFGCNPQYYPQSRTTGPSTYGQRPPIGEPGKCYAKVWIPGQIAYSTSDVAIYTGDDMSVSTVAMTTVTQKPARTKWIKKKADKNCLSKDPNDCMVWCLVEVPKEEIVIPVVTDTTSNKEFKMESIQEATGMLTQGRQEWVQVVCAGTPQFQMIEEEIIKALTAQNYLTDEAVLKGAYKEGLSRYQREHNLPEGNLDMATLESLNIQY